MIKKSKSLPLNLESIRNEFLSRGYVQDGLVAEAIERSWRRCLTNGVDIEAPSNLQVLTAKELADRQDKNRLLITNAESEIMMLSEQVSHTNSLVILTDDDGVILRTVGDVTAANEMQRASLLPGASWSEEHRGTNAIGTALMEKQEVSVQGHEHYMAYHHALSCAAVPIFDAKNQLLATLDVTNDLRTPQQHTLALVKMAAQMIENRLFRANSQADFSIHFHSRAEFIDTMWEGVAMFTEDGKLESINRSGQFQFNLNTNDRNLLTDDVRFDQLFDFAMPELQRRISFQDKLIFPIQLHNGAKFFARVESLKPLKTQYVGNPKQHANKRAASFNLLDSGDPQIASVIKQVKQVVDRDIPILIQGETGVGKELFARAIHDAGENQNKPWVAVNCAALPEGLIETELFGYEEGAFTGAKRKGSVGRIEQADGGTLFLDEIGDMPLSLQARLLRVLQERTVMPLGGTKPKSVKFSLISATNQKLKEKVAAGEFRSDLYYRINSLSVSLPALRERIDLEQLIQLILQIEQVAHAEFTPQAMQVFNSHPWPGNIRQLHNVIRTAIALADGNPIEVVHFTKDFMDELVAVVDSDAKTSDEAISLKSITNRSHFKQAENELVQLAMQQHNGNISAVARQLGVSRNTLYRKLKLLGLM
jgi:sigma-54 dependent transcriptional regulator, acetoin dehydrogenase operon transcriptional activator AcoR